jgi:translation initiation factor 2A
MKGRVLCIVSVKILLGYVAQSYAKDIEELVDNTVSRLFGQALEVPHMHHVDLGDLNSTVLYKAGHLAISPLMSHLPPHNRYGDATSVWTRFRSPDTLRTVTHAFKDMEGPYHGPNGPYHRPSGPYQRPSGPYHGPSGPSAPYHGPSGPYHGPSGPYHGPNGGYSHFQRPEFFGERRIDPTNDFTVKKEKEKEQEKDFTASDFTITDLKALLKAATASENYDLAAKYRDQISKLETDSSACVKEANDKFYEAWRQSDIRKMREIWGQGSHVQCAHPGMKCASSTEVVLDDWNKIFTEFEDMDIWPAQVQVHARRDWGIVTCVENVVTDGEVKRVHATNVFENENGRWVLVHHQACPAESCPT